LLVVLTLLSIIAGLAVVSIDLAGPERIAEEQARRLVLLIDEQCEEAILDSRELGLRVLPDGYRFSLWDGETWHEYLAPPTFKPHSLPPGFSMQLSIEGGEIILDDDPAEFEPHVLCFSSGEMTPFELAVLPPPGAPGRTLSGFRDGRVEMGGWVDGD
jgi:general secretion pathway protein H